MVPIFHYNTPTYKTLPINCFHVEICRRHFYCSEEKRGKIVKTKNPVILFYFMHFFSGTKHPREDNPNLYYWAEMTGLHTQTFNI